MKQLREEAGWRPTDLAYHAGVSVPTVYRAEHGIPISSFSAQQMLNVLSAKLERKIAMQDVEGLKVSK